MTRRRSATQGDVEALMQNTQLASMQEELSFTCAIARGAYLDGLPL